MASSELAKYPWPSTVNVANFVTMRPCLDKDNLQESIRDYKTWKEQMICLFESQDLLGFVDGETPPPPPSDQGESTEKLWRRTDRLIKGWILGSLGGDALHAVVGLNSSREVWLELENVFNNQIRAENTEVHNHLTTDGNDEINEDGIVELLPEAEASNNALDQGNIIVHSGTPYAAGKDISSYMPLYKAALRGDWTEGKKLLDEDRKGITATLGNFSETLLQIAVETGKSNYFVRNLLEIITEDAMVWKDIGGDTALHLAALVGNTEAVIMLVNKKPELQYILNNKKFLPVHLAALSCHKETVKYLVSKSEVRVENSPFVGELGAVLLGTLISSEFVGEYENLFGSRSSVPIGIVNYNMHTFVIDLALYLVKKYPNMATLKDWENDAPLEILAGVSSLFLSGESLSWWQNWIYSRIHLAPPTSSKFTRDLEKSSSIDDRATKFSWSEVAYRVTCVKRIKDKKVMHQQALELARCLCERTASLPHDDAAQIYEYSIIKAAHNGIHELVEVIVEMFPTAVFTRDAETRSSIFLLAARKRLENVFNLIYQMNDKKHFFFDTKDSSGNNFMHMCALLAPSHKLNLVSGAALQMQRELQWFEEMKKFVNPSRRMWLNKDGLTPQMLFTKEHNELKEQGEKWMKDTATSCSIAAALIATVMFSAAFTVPGGVSSDTGIPVLVHETSFVLFIISDSISLFASTTSLLMFLSILTSRYAEEDFLHVLPRRLCMGLITLFTSVTFMMFAFTIATYITLHHKSRRLIIPVALLSCLPVATFVFLQFPLLIAVLYSTYGAAGIFGKKSDNTLY